MYLIGLDIGGTKCAVTLGKEDKSMLNILSKEKFPTEKGASPFKVMEKILITLDSLLESHLLSYKNISAIGISCGGPLNSKTGVIMSPPNLPNWDNIKIVDFFKEKTNIPTFLQNDADACAVAEWKYGAGKGCKSMIFLTFGTGFGAGLILDGKLYTGASDMAGEVGHIRLEKDGPIGYNKIGSAEGFCSGGGLAQLGVSAVKKALEKGESPLLYERANRSFDNISAKLIAELAENEKDEMCLEIYDLCGQKLGTVLSILIDLLNPERIVIGGIYMRSAELIKNHMLKVIDQETLSFSNKACTVTPAGLGEKVGDYAALSVAAQHFENGDII